MTALYSWYRYRFGENGNVAPIPDGTQGGGELSLQEGWGSDFELDPDTEVNAKTISRTQHNQLWMSVTGNVNYWQQNLYPLYATAADNGGTAVIYPFGARVRFDAGAGLNTYEVINAGGTNTIPTSSSNWVLVNTAYPRSGTAGSQQRTNAQNETLFQDTGDHVPSGNSAGMLARGFTLAGIPALARPVYTFSAFTTLGTGYPGAIPLGVAVNSSNNDVFACDSSTNEVYKLTSGTGAWASIGSYPGSSPASIAVNPLNGDVFVGDLAGVLYRLQGGSGSFLVRGTYPDANLEDMAMNVTTGDLWFVSNTATATDSVVYRLPNGTTTFSNVFRYPGLRPNRIGVDSTTGTVYVSDDVLDQSGTTNARDQIYVLQDGVGTFKPIIAVQYTGEVIVGIAVDPSNSDLWIAGSNQGNSLRSPGGVDAFVAGGAPGNSFAGSIAVNGGNGTVIMADNNGNRILASTRTQVTPAVEWYIKT